MDATNQPAGRTTGGDAERSPRRRARRLLTALVVGAAAVTLTVAGLTTTSTPDVAVASTGTSVLPADLDGLRGSSWAARLPGSLPPELNRGSSWS